MCFFVHAFRTLIADDDVIEEHSSVGQLKATSEECTAVTLEECFQVCFLQRSFLRKTFLTIPVIFPFISCILKQSNWAPKTPGIALRAIVSRKS